MPQTGMVATVLAQPELATGAIIGPTGPEGSPANPNIMIVAGEAIGGHRAVYVGADGLAWLADAATAITHPPIGITVGAASLGGEVPVRSTGPLTETSWAWAEGWVYLGAAGLLTQTLPTTGTMFLIGVAAGPDRMRLDPRLIAAL